MPVVTDYTALLSGNSWNGASAGPKPIFLTYSFETSPAAYQSQYYSQAFLATFVPLSAAEQALARNALQQWADASGIVFFEVPSGRGDITFGTYDFDLAPPGSGSANAAYPAVSISPPSVSINARGGDAVFDYGATTLGVFLHEIGHALGLKHPHDGGAITLSPSVDNSANSVMSYTDGLNGAPLIKLGPLDLQAIAALYGPQSADGSQVASWSWDAATFTLTEVGRDGADTIIGVSTGNNISGGAGGDLLLGRSAADTLSGGDGNDYLAPGDGVDSISGGAGTDTLDFNGETRGVDYVLNTPREVAPGAFEQSSGIEIVYVTDFGDTLTGDAAANQFFGRNGGDVLSGGDGNDTIYGGDDNDVLSGGAGADNLTGDNGDDTLSGGDGNDTLNTERGGLGLLRGDAGDDTLFGGEGAATLQGGDGNDYLGGFEGDDVLVPGAGADTMFGGTGNDIVDFSTDASGLAYTLNVTRQLSSGVFEFTSEMEGVIGTDFADTLTGDAGANQIFGRAGNDIIDGKAGASYLRGDDGNDSIVGGAAFDDANGNMGNDTVSTGDGEDYCVGGKDNDSLSGGAAYDLVYGNLGNDTCNGDDGNDIVRGGQENDVVNGGNGDDFVSGDRGDDTMTGGAGADVFHTFGDAGLDRVSDFSLVQGDRVQLDPGTQFTVGQVGADTVISMTGGGQMVLVGVSMNTLTGAWIFGA